MLKHLKSKFPSLLPYILIIIIAGTVRYLYYTHAPGIFVSQDTYSYYLGGQRMLQTGIFVDHFRPPVYSLAHNFVVDRFGPYTTPILSQHFFDRIGYMVLIQFVFGVIGILILYKTLILARISYAKAYIFCLFISFNPVIFSWDRLLLTESLAVFFLIVLLYFTVKILKNPKTIYLFIMFLLCVLGTMLRPFFIFLPVIPLSVISLYYYHSIYRLKVFISCISVIVLYFLVLSWYSSVNFRYNGIAGISNANDMTLFSKILDFGIDVESAKDVPFYFDKVKEYRRLGREPNVFRFMEYYNLIYSDDKTRFAQTRAFDVAVLHAHLPEFIGKSFLQFPGAILETSEKTILMPPQNSTLSFFFNTLFQTGKALQILFFLILPLAPFSFYLSLRKRDYIYALVSFLGLVSIYQIFFAVFFGYAEFGRLIVPAQPLMYLFSFWWVGKIIFTVRKNFQFSNTNSQ